MVPKATVLKRYAEPTPLLVLALTAGILFLEGLALAYQSHLRDVLDQTGSLAVLEWTAFILGPFLVAPVLLFGVLYAVRSRRQHTLSLTALLPGLVVAVLVGSLSGQYYGHSVWPSLGTKLSLLVVFPSHLALLGPVGANSWIDVIEPLVADFLVAVAALAFADVRESRA